MTLTARQLTQMHRRQQLALRSVVQADMRGIWPLLDYADLEVSYPRFAAAVLASVSSRRTTSYGLAVGYLRGFRRANGLRGDFPMLRPVLPKAEFVDSTRATSLAPIKNATAHGVDKDTAMRNALVLVAGAAARLVLNAGRETVIGSVREDPDGRGFVRVVGGGGCDYCQERAGIFLSGESEVFHSHGGCGCTAEPVYSGQTEESTDELVPEPEAKPEAAVPAEVEPEFKKSPGDPRSIEEAKAAVDRLAPKLTDFELRAETKRGSEYARYVARKELKRRGL